MQTFLPVPDFLESARCLDRQRLGAQRKEAWQIAQVHLGLRTGWASHPAARMWAGYLPALRLYILATMSVWEDRGYRNIKMYENVALIPDGPVEMPHWLGNERFHRSHRSNLLRKAPEHYSQFGWVEPPDLPYYWPQGKREALWPRRR